MIPFVHLAGDNHKHQPALRGRRARLILAPAYRQAKAACALLARTQWRQPPLAGELALVMRLWFPDRRKRDTASYGKLVCDALSGIVYIDDVQLSRVTYERAGYDKVNPRAVITVTTYEQEAA